MAWCENPDLDQEFWAQMAELTSGLQSVRNQATGHLLDPKLE